MRHYSGDPAEHKRPKKLRDDVLVRFATQRTSVTPPDPLPGDCIDQPITYDVDPIVFAELRNGAITRHGFVFTERNELLRESVDKASYTVRLARSHPDLQVELDATAPEPSPEAVAVLGCQRAGNYFHWWIDVLAKCWVLRNSPYRTYRLVTPPLTQDFQRESLRLLNQSVTPMTRPLHRFHRMVFARGLTYGSAQALSPQITEFAQWCRTTLALRPSSRRRKLFISRRSARSRRLLNEDEVIAALGADFELVELETLSVREKALLLAEATVVVAPHGAGLTNLLFCAEPTAVVELVHDDAPPKVFRRLAGLLGHPYIAVGCRPETQEEVKQDRRDMRASPSDVDAAIARLQKAAVSRR
ncbi:MAG: glycosyltransferase family 61 protein [Solirubrobacterales bacterium]